MIEIVSELAITMCGLFIVVSVLESILPQGSVSNVIRWVVLIFVLVTLFGSINSINTQELLHYFETDENVMADDAGAAVLDQAVVVLEDRAKSALNAQDINYNSLEVVLSQDESGLDIRAVKVYGELQSQKDLIQDVLNNVFETQVEVIYE